MRFGEVVGVTSDEWVWKNLDFGAEIQVDIRKKYKLEFKPHPPRLILGEPFPQCYASFEIEIAELRAIHDFVKNEV